MIASLANPNVLFVFIWTSVLFLYSLRILNVYDELNLLTIALIMTNVCISLILIVLFKARYRRHVLENCLRDFTTINRMKINRFIKVILAIYVFISILDICFSGGVPLYWALSGDSRQYIDFGIPTLHGIANSILFFSASLLFFLTKVNNKCKQVKFILWVLFLYQIVILSRGTIIVMVVQMLGIYLFFYKGSIKKILMMLLFFSGFIIGFGYLGDIRQGGNPYYGFLADEWKGFFDAMPSGSLWGYVYFTSGLNNLNFNMDIVEPVYFPVYTFAKLIPSVFYSLLGIDKAVDSYTFVEAGLNVSTIYSAFYSDFGYLAFGLVAVIQLIASYSYCRARRGSLYALLAYTIAFQAVFLSFFIDTFFYIPFLFQFFIIFLLKGYLREKRFTI
jgi:oligosaccharide repeat unit polymerase